MTTIDESRAHRVDEAVIEPDFDEAALLHEEIDRMRQRVEDLELTVQEYRSQMSKMLGSASWKFTSPIRITAARARTARVRARRLAKKLKHGRGAVSGGSALTAGLFMPPLDSLPETSPLRRPIDVNLLRRPTAADGPLHRPADDPTILVVAHVHYPELWGDIEDRLTRIPVAYDLLVTVTEGSAAAVIPRIMSRNPRARIEVVPNRGRDWAPLVRLANMGLLSGYDAIAKVHTKKSEHRLDGDSWRIALLDGVFESPDQIRRTIDLLKEDRSVGVIVPTGQLVGTEHWGSDQPIVEALAYRLSMAFDPDELQFPAGSMFWCRPWILERLADLDINDRDFEQEAGQYDATTAHGLERLVGVFTKVGGMDIVESMDVSRRLRDYRKNPVERPTTYAFYLPQYHQCPENDRFWGEGFTDWDNVKEGKPLFVGHRQPILPSEEVGFYNLKDPGVLRQQADMAIDHGIDGFIFHYYWFNGQKVLDAPINNWLNDPTIELPLAICWANEGWTRRWDGLDQDVLIEQSYGDDWANRFWDDIAEVLRDPRYIHVDGKPLLIIYRPAEMPEPIAAIRTWRRRAVDDGHRGIHILAVAAPREHAPLPSELVSAVDGVIGFPPSSSVRLAEITRQATPPPGEGPAGTLSYAAAVSSQVFAATGFNHPCVIPGWDNTARRKSSAYVFLGANTATWAGQLRSMVGRQTQGQPDLVFINAWNEWAEGAVLEPSMRFGRGTLASLRDVLGARRSV